ncbi:MAG: 5-methyltetrahydropteroyltriglutamate--homocysteine S-methyltransferase [Elusimicrobia bacterium]|nr:5-methyltetrahydropteroyltriglutamate--homocysteine S-methyltransferase [Elusimicrobiota bacterium]
MKTYAYGYPRLGRGREFKKIIESFWNGKISKRELKKGLGKLEEEIIYTYSKNVDLFPVGEFTYYDNMLDTAVMLGVYNCPEVNFYFDLCRGKSALDMTKWFNTNYHYLVPEIKSSKFKVSWNKPLKSYKKFKKGTPYFIGPFTFLKLSKCYKKNSEKILLKLAGKYTELISRFNRVHIDEPAFCMELSKKEIQSIKKCYKILEKSGTDIYLFTYYDSVDFLDELLKLDVKAIGLDFVHGEENIKLIKKYGWDRKKILITGLVDGRNVWRTDIKKAVSTIKTLKKYADEIFISNAGPLWHLPITIKSEKLPAKLGVKLAFAEERLYELNLIAKTLNDETKKAAQWCKGINSSFGKNETVRRKIKNLKKNDFKRIVPFSIRKKIHKKLLNLPLFPTTTIGSFPQTDDVRKMRALYNRKEISSPEYKKFIRNKIKELVRLQEDIGLDVLVHGEFERTDMVEFFAKKLSGIATTKNGWIISYGTRGYRPPIFYGDISRPKPMTVDEIAFAQSQTKKIVKGMLTGPVTMIAWSYIREDIPTNEVAYQLSLCIQEEIKDYEKKGIKIVQIDEPAFREKAPIKKRHWKKYFDWAVKSFRLSISKAKPETQIHSHMCYSEFHTIIKQIMEMDFDVISIEAARSHGDIINAFENVKFNRQIGLGVWDIHSPAIAEVPKIKKIVRRALAILAKENFWINPDCGLKTRKWEETIPSLKNLIKATKSLREIYSK